MGVQDYRVDIVKAPLLWVLHLGQEGQASGELGALAGPDSLKVHSLLGQMLCGCFLVSCFPSPALPGSLGRLVVMGFSEYSLIN